MNRVLDIGVVGKNIIGNEQRPFGSSLAMGVLLKNQSNGIKLFSDLVVDSNRTGYPEQYGRYGLDVSLSPDFTVRLGGDPRYYTAGVSFDFLKASVDYAVKSPRVDDDERVVALGVRFGRAKEPAEFRRKYALFKPKSLAYIQIDGTLTSGKSSVSLLGGKKIGSNDLLRLIDAANHDKDCSGYLIRVKNLAGSLGDIAIIQEVRNELLKGKSRGKKIYVYLDGWASLPSYYLASIGDIIAMPPLGAIHELGIQFELLKFEDAMKKFGIGYQSFSSGKFKVATSPFTPAMTDSQKETITSSLENIMSQVQTDIQLERSESIDTVIYDGRILSANDAKDRGLVDTICFWSDMKSLVKDDMKKGVQGQLIIAGIGAYFDSKPTNILLSSFNRIAVVEINGPIQAGQARDGLIFGGVSTGSGDVTRVFSQLEKDPFVQGVIIRVNSPGGSILAADEILNAIKIYKKKVKKPVYASMGNVAASGGYYIAMGTDKVFANPSTITGSIGVVSGFLNFNGLEEDLGVKTQSLSTGKHMDARSQHQKISKDSVAMIQTFQQESYDHFKSIVQDARDLTDDEVNAVSQGQFMTGKEALSVGLIDELGSYSDAVQAMEDDLGMPDSELVLFGRKPLVNPFRALFQSLIRF